ncbi:cytochrome P450 [Agrocybe pediades]|nr:cytochrome P450 [Agrocybe pediades]
MNPLVVATSLTIIVGSVYHLYRRWTVRFNRYPLPPGPKPLFLVGNLFDIITKSPWLYFTDLKKEYVGDLIYLEAFGQKVLVLNSLRAAQELLEKRATVYSHRPSFTMIGELIGLNNSLPMLPYGPEFKRQRTLCHSGLSPTAVKKYHSIQETAIASYALKLCEDPSQFLSELRMTAGRIVLSVTYGFPVQSIDSIYLDESEATMDMIEKGTVIGAFAVDIIPALKYLPSWVPFNNIHKTAESGRNLLFGMVDRPYRHVKQALEAGAALPSFAADCLMRVDDTKLLDAGIDDSIRWAAGSMYGAGGETSFATIMTFIYAMALYPNVQAKIHKEIEEVVGMSRLPNLGDKDRLPYVQAAIKETMRWKPALPMSIPRMTTENDHYNGYHIPAGTVVIPNVWAMSRDEETGIPSSIFAPERFMGLKNGESSPVDPTAYAFGFGRRACPGKYLGENNIFLFVTYIVSAVSISRLRDERGNYLPLDPPYTTGLVSYPEPFLVNFSPRNKERVAQLISKCNKEGEEAK